MLFAFRADASIEIGSGHIMRCLALADELASKKIRSVFLTRKLSGHLIEIILYFTVYRVILRKSKIIIFAQSQI